MLPTVTQIKTTVVAAAALATMLATTPAQAFGDNERNFVQGLAAGVLIDRLLIEGGRNARAPQPAQHSFVPPQPLPSRAHGHVVASTSGTGLYRTPAAYAFNSYAMEERKTIQRRLAAYGYYRSGIDGVFGPGTYNAVNAFARDSGNTAHLTSRDTAFAVYDALIY